MIEIQCDDCQEWTPSTDACESCGAPRAEYVLFRGPEADAILIPMALRGLGARPNEAANS